VTGIHDAIGLAWMHAATAIPTTLFEQVLCHSAKQSCFRVTSQVDREERPDVDRVYMAYVQACIVGCAGCSISCCNAFACNVLLASNSRTRQKKLDLLSETRNPGQSVSLGQAIDAFHAQFKQGIVDATNVVQACGCGMVS
jgi:hypothetical protein